VVVEDDLVDARRQVFQADVGVGWRIEGGEQGIAGHGQLLE